MQFYFFVFKYELFDLRYYAFFKKKKQNRKKKSMKNILRRKFLFKPQFFTIYKCYRTPVTFCNMLLVNFLLCKEKNRICMACCFLL